MKKLKYVVALLFLLVSVASYGQNSEKEVLEINTKIYCDHCKMCDSCGKNIYDAVHALNGIKKVEILEKESKVRVHFNAEKINADDIRKAISDAGYDADDVKANPLAYEKFDGCCKKK